MRRCAILFPSKRPAIAASTGFTQLEAAYEGRIHKSGQYSAFGPVRAWGAPCRSLGVPVVIAYAPCKPLSLCTGILEIGAPPVTCRFSNLGALEL
jgi:hypothetical protein